jgi:hypothetical protein
MKLLRITQSNAELRWKMLAGLVQEGLATAVSESLKAGGTAIKVVRFWSLPRGEGPFERQSTTAL